MFPRTFIFYFSQCSGISSILHILTLFLSVFCRETFSNFLITSNNSNFQLPFQYKNTEYLNVYSFRCWVDTLLMLCSNLWTRWSMFSVLRKVSFNFVNIKFCMVYISCKVRTESWRFLLSALVAISLKIEWSCLRWCFKTK